MSGIVNPLQFYAREWHTADGAPAIGEGIENPTEGEVPVLNDAKTLVKLNTAATAMFTWTISNDKKVLYRLSTDDDTSRKSICIFPGTRDGSLSKEFEKNLKKRFEVLKTVLTKIQTVFVARDDDNIVATGIKVSKFNLLLDWIEIIDLVKGLGNEPYPSKIYRIQEKLDKLDDKKLISEASLMLEDVIRVSNFICKLSVISQDYSSGECLELLSENATQYEVIPSGAYPAIFTKLIHVNVRGSMEVCIGMKDDSEDEYLMPVSCCEAATTTTHGEYNSAIANYCPLANYNLAKAIMMLNWIIYASSSFYVEDCEGEDWFYLTPPFITNCKLLGPGSTIYIDSTKEDLLYQTVLDQSDDNHLDEEHDYKTTSIGIGSG